MLLTKGAMVVVDTNVTVDVTIGPGAVVVAAVAPKQEQALLKRAASVQAEA